MAKKKQADDLYDLIAGALPETKEESNKPETKEEGVVKFNELSYTYGVVPDKEKKRYFNVVEISFDLSTGFARIEGIVDGADLIQVAIVKAEQRIRSNLILNRRKV